MSSNPYKPINAEIVDIIDESSTIKTFVVVPENDFKFETGQFVELTLPGEGEAPFTPSSSPDDTKLCRFGARTPDDLIYKNTLFGSWQKIDGVDMKLTVDEGNGQWKGNVGVVTTICEPKDVNVKKAVAVVCGPPIMMKFATLKLLEFGFADKDIYLSMEKNMSCGIGKCGHCMLGKYYVCKDGPVFTYDQIKGYPKIWD